MNGKSKLHEHMICMISVIGIVVVATILSSGLSKLGVEDDNHRAIHPQFLR